MLLDISASPSSIIIINNCMRNVGLFYASDHINYRLEIKLFFPFVVPFVRLIQLLIRSARLTILMIYILWQLQSNDVSVCQQQ